MTAAPVGSPNKGWVADGPPKKFAGWRMLGLATLTLILTTPGQTIGVSSFIDHMIEDLEVSRSAISTAYLVGTLTAATAMPAVGRWVDRRGISHTMALVGVAFTVAIAFAGFAQNIWMLGLAFVGLRMFGQGSLSLIGDTTISLWFQEQRGRAFAIAMTLTSGIMSLSPLFISAIIGGVGWRQAWWVLAAVVALTVIPIARFLIIDRPSSVGQIPDGTKGVAVEDFVPQRSFTVSEAIRTAAFWSLISITALASALSTALTFHNVSVMAEGGLTEAEAARIFIPLSIGAVFASFVVGWLTDRVSSRVLIPLAPLAFALAALLGTATQPGARSLVYGLTLGLAGGTVRALSSTLFPKWFGADHIGSIKGVVQTVSVAASAIGPLLLSLGNDLSDGYYPALRLSAGIALAIAIGTTLVRDPSAVAD